MLGNYLSTALRNLARNGLYAGVTIGGLAVAFAAAILIALFVRDEYSYDRFIPGAERTYRVEEILSAEGRDPSLSAHTPPMLAAALTAESPQIEAVARIAPAPRTAVRRGQVEAQEEDFVWADPDIFKVLPVPAIAGDLSAALAAPDGVVITRSIARKYFGKDGPLGETLEIERLPMRVTAVIEDLPSQTHLTFSIAASGRSSNSAMRLFEERHYGPLTNVVLTYVRLSPGASIGAVRRALPDFTRRHILSNPPPGLRGLQATIYFTALTDIHLRSISPYGGKPKGDETIIAAIALIGVLIVLVAAVNFIILMTARASRRAVEVGVRKAAGARRVDLVIQFMGEAFIQVLAAALIAMALAELLSPALDAFLQRRIAVNLLTDPMLILGLGGLVLAVASGAGAYPAFVLSGFRPASVLKGSVIGLGRSGLQRQVLVVFQFVVLIALILAAVTVYRQTRFALKQGALMQTEQTLAVFVSPCTLELRDRVRALAGVRGAACSSNHALNQITSMDSVQVEGRRAVAAMVPIDFGFLDVYGVKPVAGRAFDERRPADVTTDGADAAGTVLLNEKAAREFGFTNPAVAVGKSLLWHARGTPDLKPSEIIGVLPDFTFGSLREPIRPAFYLVSRGADHLSTALNVKLAEGHVEETLKALDGAVKQAGDGRPISRRFTDEAMQRLYVDTIQQGIVMAICAGIALAIACMGLFALSAYATERRTKEIGIRKAMGATSWAVLKLLIWQFTKPVLIANLIAWPLAFLIMRRWLEGFAYRVDLSPWTFLTAGGAALVIAWATVFVHAWSVARAKPITALRYE